MINLMFLLSPGSCGSFCLRYVLRKRIKKESYLNLYRVKEILNSFGYYCSCLRVYDIKDVNEENITLIRVGKVSFHYVVIKRVSDIYVYYYDPLFLFIRKKKIDKFTKKWCNICLFYTKV